MARTKGGRPITIVVYVKAKPQEVSNTPHKDRIIARAIEDLINGQEIVIEGEAYDLEVAGWRVGK